MCSLSTPIWTFDTPKTIRVSRTQPVNQFSIIFTVITHYVNFRWERIRAYCSKKLGMAIICSNKIITQINVHPKMKKMRSLTFIPHHSNEQITKHKPFKISVSTLALYPETYSHPDIFFGSGFWWGMKIKKRERKTKLKAKNMKIIFQKSHIYKKSQLKQTDRHHQTTTAQHPRGTVQEHKKKEPERSIITERHQTNGWMVWTDIFISWMTECLWTFL